MSSPRSIEALALVSRAPRAPLSIEPIRVDPPGRGEIRVWVLASGICHTDQLVMLGRPWWPDHPYVLGHEGVGLVESVGQGVNAERVGELVVMAWRAACDSCRACRSGRPWLCSDPRRAHGRLHLRDGLTATPSLRVGSHAVMAVVAADQAIPIPSHLDPETACLIGCAVMTGIGAVRNTARVEAGQGVVVLGCGGVGLSAIAGSRLAGASPIVAVDPVPARLAVAERLGATHLVVGGRADVAGQVRAIAHGTGVDHAFEAVGRPEVLLDALGSLDTGGTCTILGTPDPGVTAVIPLELLYFRRLTIRVSQYGDSVPIRDAVALAALMASGDLDVAPLVGRVIGLAEAPDAVARLGADVPVRTVIRLPDPPPGGDP